MSKEVERDRSMDDVVTAQTTAQVSAAEIGWGGRIRSDPLLSNRTKLLLYWECDYV